LGFTGRESGSHPGLDQRELPFGVHGLGSISCEHLIEEADMARSGSQERNKGASQQAHGRLKEAIGALTGNRQQAQQGRADQVRGRLRERWGHLKDALRR
jgi:uncharacterized protein YjbJ (UPF0337 family)